MTEIEAVPNEPILLENEDMTMKDIENNENENNEKSQGLKFTYEVSKKLAKTYTGGPLNVSFDEKYILSTCDTDLHFLDFENGIVKKIIEGESMITSIAVHPKKPFVVINYLNGFSQVWTFPEQTTRPTMVHTWKNQEPITAATYDPSGTLLALALTGFSIKVFDVEENYLTHEFFGHSAIITSLRFHPQIEKLQLLSTSIDATCRVWDLKRRQCRQILDDHQSAVTATAFTGKYLITVARDRIINIYKNKNKNKNTSKPFYTLKRSIPVYEGLEDVAAVEEEHSHAFVTCGEKGRLRMWNAKTGELILEQNKDQLKGDRRRVLYCPQNNLIITVALDSYILLHKPSNLERIRTIHGYNDEILDLRYLEDHLSIVVASNTENIRVVSLVDNNCRILGGHTETVIAIDVTSDQTMLVSASKDNTIRIWDLRTFRCVAVGRGHAADVCAVAVAPKHGRYCVTASSDKTMKVWDLRTVFDEVNHENTIDHSQQKPMEITPVATTVAHTKDVNALSISPNDRYVASASSDKSVKLWEINVETKKLDKMIQPLGTCIGHKRVVWDVQFSPIDKCLASSSSDKTVRIWSLKDFSCLKVLEAPTPLMNIRYVTRGLQMVGTSAAGNLHLWTVETEQLENTFEGHDGETWGLCQGKDGDLIFTGGSDSVLNIWKDRTVDISAEASKEQDQLIENEQQLSNYLYAGEYIEAVRTAVKLNQPSKLYQTIEKLIDARADLDEALASIDVQDLHNILPFILDWNTNSRYSSVAQRVLYSIFRHFGILDFIGDPSRRMETVQMLEGMKAYSRRHFQRVDRLLQHSYILDYILNSSKMVLPSSVGEGVPEEEPETKDKIEPKAKRTSNVRYINTNTNGNIDTNTDSEAQNVRKAVFESLFSGTKSSDETNASSSQSGSRAQNKNKHDLDADSIDSERPKKRQRRD